MSDHKKFKDESQDARRRDQHKATHPTADNHKRDDKKSPNLSK